MFLHEVTKWPWHISARSFQSLEPWIGSRLSGCILPCPVPLVDPAGHGLWPFLPYPAGLGYVLSDTPTAFTAEGRYFRTESIIMDLGNPGFWTVPGFTTCGPSPEAFPQKKWRQQHTILKLCCRHEHMETREALITSLKITYYFQGGGIGSHTVYVKPIQAAGCFLGLQTILCGTHMPLCQIKLSQQCCLCHEAQSLTTVIMFN